MIIEMKPRDPAKPDVRRCIQTIRTRLAEVIRLLEYPDAASVEQCAPTLAEAAALLGQLERCDLNRDRDRSDVYAVRADIARVEALLAQAAQFHRAWAQILGAAASGYTPAGAAALDPAPTVSIHA